MEAAEAWDTSKENFAPSRAGRSAKGLREVPLSASKSVSSELEERRK